MGLLHFFRRQRKAAPPEPNLKEIWRGFQQVLANNNESLAIMGDLEEGLAGRKVLDLQTLRSRVELLDRRFTELVAALQQMSGGRFRELETAWLGIKQAIHDRLGESPRVPPAPLVVPLEEADDGMLPALGGKGGNLARVRNRLGLPVPDGVVATLSAYRLFMDQPGPSGSLWERLQGKLTHLDLADAPAVAQTSRELQAMVLAQPLPEELLQALLQAAGRLAPQGGPTLTVRSSGGREDLAATFAGQYESFLGVSPAQVPERWRQVVASQFGERAILYFRLRGLLLEEAAMGVLIQRLVPARASGVMFTTDLESCDPGRLVVSAVWGLAADLVAGKVSGDEYLVAKENGRLLQARCERKEYLLALVDGMLERQPVAPELVAAPVLEAPDLECLAGWARTLEEWCGCPHGVEWAKDPQGRFYVVQSRHLLHLAAGERGLTAAPPVPPEAQVLLASGSVAAPGAAAGLVFHLREGRPLAEVPPRVVLVAPRTTPELAPVLPRLAALVTDVGSATGHLALLAREYSVPAVVDTKQASATLPEGELVTVDAYHGRVYRGQVEELLRLSPGPAHPRDAFFHERLRAVLDLIVPLNLVDRRSPDFRPENCRTYHDVTRFAHEKAIQVMFGLMDKVAAGRVPALRLLKLKTPLPLNLHLVDLGDGLASHETPVPPEDIVSRPMRALWRGISHPGITWAGPVPVDMGGFLHVLGQSAIRPPEKFWDKTYAIVGANYVNYACRLGYHFQSVDSYIGEVPLNNYINFTFKGGAADDVRRIRRIRLIATVLERLGFTMEIHGDVIRARLRRRPAPEMEERLDLLGRLMAYVRQMDMLMSDDATSQLLAERFLAGHYERPGQDEPREQG